MSGQQDDPAFRAGYAAGGEAFREIWEEMRHLPRAQQRAFLQARHEELLAKRAETAEKIGEMEAQVAHLNAMKGDIAAIEATFQAWERGEYALGRLPHSLMHRVLEAHGAGKTEFGEHVPREQFTEDFAARIKKAVPFVIEHDWASAFAGAHDFDEGDYQLPFENVAFELRVDGRHLCLLASDDDVRLMLFQFGDGWFVSRWDAEAPRWCERMARAVCIALEAEAATTEAIRAPTALNRSRERQGKPPLLDYHVVRLDRRRRVAPLPVGEETHSDRRMRLHFMRGHWRHYENHKTWIRWHLRGDPDLGFIDKHYRL